MSAHLVSSHLLSKSSHIFLGFSPQLISALVSSSHLSALSNHLSSSLAQNLLQKRIPAPKQATPTLSTEKFLHREAFTQLFHIASFHTENPLHRKALHRAAFTHSKLLHTASLYTQQAWRSFCTEKLLHTEAFSQSKLSHREALAQRNIYTEKLLNTEAFTQRSFYAHQQLQNRISTPKPKKNESEALFLNVKRKMSAPKLRKSATLMQPLHYDLRCPAARDICITHATGAPSNLDAAITVRSAQAELQNAVELRATASEIAAPKLELGAEAKKKMILKHVLKEILKGKSQAPKLRKYAHKALLQP